MSTLTDQWNPIATAPKDGSRILLWDGYPVFASWSTDAEHGSSLSGPSEAWQIFSCEDSWYSYCANSPTHWMPLPKPPFP